ncbi:hypothetical protein GGF46_004518 [Coemansia sp. RSA 552]|nr:hypothetical protein GGF46_004518 [Coemansia sp. RSA 552]
MRLAKLIGVLAVAGHALSAVVPATNTSSTDIVPAANTSMAASGMLAPLWFEEEPEISSLERHQTNYLLCKKAHGGREQWTDTAGTECVLCFCMASTRRVGCARCKDTAEKLEVRSNRRPGVYVNHEACVRANLGRTFTRGCMRCVCHQNGAVACSENSCPRRVLRSGRSRELCIQEHGRESFMVGNQSCVCTDSGMVVCTLKAV